ncbi:MAG: hypothetical protein LBS09_09685 [Bacteroidales bacterium]|jgi:hypothetical protein|nr:hypothetical protein [Bacteroidales bacterium]
MKKILFCIGGVAIIAVAAMNANVSFQNRKADKATKVNMARLSSLALGEKSVSADGCVSAASSGFNYHPEVGNCCKSQHYYSSKCIFGFVC